MAATFHAAVRAAVRPDRLLDLLRQMVAANSYTQTPGERALAVWLAEEIARRGLQVEVRPVLGDRLNVLGSLPGSGDAPSLMLNGHIDTNMVGLGWTRDPWGAEVADNCIFGIGVSNMKAADAAMLEALTAVRDLGIPLRGTATLALVVGELQGGVGTLQLIEDGVRADYFIVGEPTDLAVLTAHAGSFECIINVFGRTRHLSKLEEAVNAIERMSDVIGALRTLRFTGGERPEHAALQRVNVGSIRGGVGRECQDWRAPLVPDFCTLRLAVRIAPSQTLASALDDITRTVEALRPRLPDLEFEVLPVAAESKRYMPPFGVDPDHPFVRDLIAAHTALAGQPPLVGAVAPYRYYGTDAAHLAAAGMTGVVYGPGGKFNTMPDERVEVADVVLAAQSYALAVLNTCGPRAA